MRKISLEEFQSECAAQGVERQHIAFTCPICKTVQSMASLVKAGVPEDKVEIYAGFSCEGRWTGAGSFHADKRRGKSVRGCDWTLGGLFKMHELEVTAPDGEVHPLFRLATPEQALELKAAMEAADAQG